MTPVESVVFWVASIVAVIGGIGVISSRSAIYSALSLILTLSQLAVLYLLLNAQFIAAAQILIYAGAVMVLFLFVITLLGVQEFDFMGRNLPGQQLFAVIFGALMLLSIVYFVGQAPSALTAPHGHFNQQLTANNVSAFGHALFTTFVFPFEATTLLLIVAMVGAVSLGRRHVTSHGPTEQLDQGALSDVHDDSVLGGTGHPVDPVGATTEPVGVENDTRS